MVSIGVVTRVNVNNGEIFVKVANGFELEELHNVLIQSVANNQVLQYETATSLWKNKAIDKTTVGLSNVDNTSDINKPVSTATQTAIDSISDITRGKKGMSFFTDFIGPATVNSTYGLNNGVSGATISSSVNTSSFAASNQQGIIEYNTLTTATSHAHHSGNTIANIGFGGGIWNYETSIYIPTLSTALERYRLFFGFGNTVTNSDATNGVYFTYDEGGTGNGASASANWQCITGGSSVRTLTITTVPVVINTWIKLRIEVNAAATSVAFYINGTLVATITTNIPTYAANRTVTMKQGISKTIGLTARNFYCDYIGYENILTTPRT